MTIKEAIKQRHMVRKYTDKPIPSNLKSLNLLTTEKINLPAFVFQPDPVCDQGNKL